MFVLEAASAIPFHLGLRKMPLHSETKNTIQKVYLHKYGGLRWKYETYYRMGLFGRFVWAVDNEGM